MKRKLTLTASVQTLAFTKRILSVETLTRRPGLLTPCVVPQTCPWKVLTHCMTLQTPSKN